MKKTVTTFTLFILIVTVAFAGTYPKTKNQSATFSNVPETYEGTGRPYALDYYWDFPYGPLHEHGEFYYKYDRFYGSEDQRKRSYQNLNNMLLLGYKAAENKQIQEEIAKIKVVQSKFYKQYTPDTAPISIAEITVENNSKTSVITIFCRGRLISYKTGEVLVDYTFKYDMPKVLPGGAKETYEIDLNRFVLWSKVKVSDLTKFEVDIVGIETNEGKVLIVEFSKEAKKSIKKTKKKYEH